MPFPSRRARAAAAVRSGCREASSTFSAPASMRRGNSTCSAARAARSKPPMPAPARRCGTAATCEVSVAAEVAAAYFRLRTAQAQRANAEAELDRQQRLERLLAAQARGGLITGQELSTQQRGARRLPPRRFPALEAQARAEIHALGVLVGSTPGSADRAADAGRRHPGGADHPRRAAVRPAAAPSRRARRRARARRGDRRHRRRRRRPLPAHLADARPRPWSAPRSPACSNGAAAASASAPRSTGPCSTAGGARATVEAKNARQEQAMIAYRKTVLDALRDVEDALGRIEADRVQLAEQQEAARNAARAEEHCRHPLSRRAGHLCRRAAGAAGAAARDGAAGDRQQRRAGARHGVAGQGARRRLARAGARRSAQ